MVLIIQKNVSNSEISVCCHMNEQFTFSADNLEEAKKRLLERVGDSFDSTVMQMLVKQSSPQVFGGR